VRAVAVIVVTNFVRAASKVAAVDFAHIHDQDSGNHQAFVGSADVDWVDTEQFEVVFDLLLIVSKRLLILSTAFLVTHDCLSDYHAVVAFVGIIEKNQLES